MIKLIKSGRYKLIRTKHYVKILYLDKDAFAWIEPPKIHELLVTTHRQHKTDCLLSVGRYNLYDLKDDQRFSSHLRLELEVGEGQWQGYLLLNGLPTDQKIRCGIIPAHDVVTGSVKNIEIEEYTKQLTYH